MSLFGEEIFNRLPAHSGLTDKNNPVRKVLDNSIGEWLTAFDEEDWFSQFFLTDATGKYLDLHGKMYNVIRKNDENDESYRERIIYESLGQLTTYFLSEIYNVELYTFVNNFNIDDNVLLSDNEYISTNGFFIVADEKTKKILSKKFVLDTNVVWLDL